jgi:hypothetical protein
MKHRSGIDADGDAARERPARKSAAPPDLNADAPACETTHSHFDQPLEARAGYFPSLP